MLSPEFTPLQICLLLALVVLPWVCRAVVVAIALRGAKPKDRPEILRAVAECFRWRSPTRGESRTRAPGLAGRRRVEGHSSGAVGRTATRLDASRSDDLGELRHDADENRGADDRNGVRE